MWTSRLKISAAFLIATAAVTGGGMLAQEARTQKPTDSAAMAETEANLAKLRELVRPKPGEYVTNMAKIAWEREPWEAGVRAGKEGKPVIAYGPGMVGLPCGHG